MGRSVIERDGKFAVQETVSDEEFLTPWFDTKKDLANHLAEHGDSWGSGPIPKHLAEKFVESGFVPSMGIIGGRMLKTYQLADPFWSGKETFAEPGKDGDG